jgi:hypothetical protein
MTADLFRARALPVSGGEPDRGELVPPMHPYHAYAVGRKPDAKRLRSLPGLLRREAAGRLSLFRQPRAYARSRLPSPGGTREDAPVEVLETRTRGRPKASRHRLTSDAIIAGLLECPRS